MKKYDRGKFGRIAAAMATIILILALSACGMSGEGYKIGAAAAKVSVIPESGTQTARTNSDAASMTTAKPSSNPDVAYKTKNEMMFSTKQLSVAAVGYDPNGKNDRGEKALVIKLRCTNKTKKDLQLNFGPFGVNRFFGYFVKSQGTDTIPAEKTVYASLVIDQAALDQLEADSVDEIIGKYYVRGEKNESGGFTIYPTGKTAQEITPAKSFSEEDVTVLADNDYILFGVLKDNDRTKALTSAAKADDKQIRFYAKCRSGVPYNIETDCMAVNGKEYYEVIGGEKVYLSGDEWGSVFTLMECSSVPDCSYIFGYRFNEQFMKENKINGVKDIKKLTMGLLLTQPIGDKELFADLISYNPDGPKEKKPAYATVDYKGDHPIWATGDYILMVTGIEPIAYIHNWNGYKQAFLIRMRVTNRTDRDWEYKAGDEIAVNQKKGFGNEDAEYVVVPPGKSSEINLYIPSEDFEDRGIKSVDSVSFSFQGGPGYSGLSHFNTTYTFSPSGRK